MAVELRTWPLWHDFGRTRLSSAAFGDVLSVPVYIFSEEHDALWREEGSGYTIHPDEAGVWTLEQAYALAGHCGPEKGIVFWESGYAAKIQRLEERVQRLTQDLYAASLAQDGSIHRLKEQLRELHRNIQQFLNADATRASTVEDTDVTVPELP